MTVRSKRLLALLYTHVKSTLPRDVWMVLNVCNVKMIDIKKIKELQLRPIFKKVLFVKLIGLYKGRRMPGNYLKNKCLLIKFSPKKIISYKILTSKNIFPYKNIFYKIIF